MSTPAPTLASPNTARWAGYAFWAIYAGLALQVTGLGVDAWLHERDPALASRESIFSLANPGHLMFIAGLGLSLAGVLARILLAETRRWLRLAPGLALVLLATASGVYALQSGSLAGAHEHAAADADHETLATGDSLLTHGEHDATHNVEISAGELDALSKQVTAALAATERYKDVRTAVADGYIQIMQDAPEVGAHFLNWAYLQDRVFDPSKPELLVYTKQTGWWQLYAASYLSSPASGDAAGAPEGFAGPLDTWHSHENLCFTLSGVTIETAQACETRTGLFVSQTGYMMHLWVVDNPNGLFANSHPQLKGSPLTEPFLGLDRLLGR